MVEGTETSKDKMGKGGELLDFMVKIVSELQVPEMRERRDGDVVGRRQNQAC